MHQKIKIIKIIHLALSTGVTLAYLFIGDFKNILNIEIDNSFLIYSFIPVIAYVLSNLIFKNTLKQIKKDTSTNEKLAIYQSASIFKWAILEGACFLILFLKPEYILLGVVLLFYMILLAPKDDKIFQLLDIKSSNF